MKKQIFAVLAVMFALAIVSCDNFPTGDDGLTNVEYTTDGSGNLTGITLYLEGGVPRTAENRALSLQIAKAASNYYEVVFTNGSEIARASWSPGESAVIKGVPRVAYGTTIGAINKAVLFAGRKSDRTLLAVGLLSGGTESDGSASTPGTITNSTVSVTFSLNAFTGGGANVSSSYAATTNGTLATATIFGTAYPAIEITKATPPAIPSTVTATITYTLGGATALTNYLPGIWYRTGAKVEIKAPTLSLSNTLVDVPAPLLLPQGTPTIGITPPTAGVLTSESFVITISPAASTIEGSISSFYFEVPVNAINATAATDGTPAVNWFIRPGYGINLPVLDKGTAGDLGGSLLITYGEPSSEYILITGSF